MTRINLGILPVELCDQHLIAEYRELPRLFNFKTTNPNIPKHFKLGSGHVLWCASYLGTMKERQKLIVNELLRRNVNITFIDVPDITGDDKFCGKVEHTIARGLIKNRINERLKTMKRKTWTKSKKPKWVHYD